MRSGDDPRASGDLVGVLHDHGRPGVPARRRVGGVEGKVSLSGRSRRSDLELTVPIKGRSGHQVQLGRHEERLDRGQPVSSSHIFGNRLGGIRRSQGRGWRWRE
jgi:hypothetical protein